MKNFKCEINYHFSPSERILVRNPRFIMCDGCADRGSDWSVAWFYFIPNWWSHQASGSTENYAGTNPPHCLLQGTRVWVGHRVSNVWKLWVFQWPLVPSYVLGFQHHKELLKIFLFFSDIMGTTLAVRRWHVTVRSRGRQPQLDTAVVQHTWHAISSTTIGTILEPTTLWPITVIISPIGLKLFSIKFKRI